MKKVLALIVAFALCFTAFAGCFATSAAPVTGYAFDITAATDDLTSDGGDVVVTVSGKYTTIDTAQYLVVTLPANVEFVSVAGGEDISEVDNPTEETVILYAFDEAANQIKFLEACEPDVDFAIEITVNVPAYSEEATNEYVIEANAQVAAFDAASSEDITTIEDSVTITVPAPHVHQAAADAAWQNDADNHWKVCAEHADVKVEEAAHDYNTVVTEPTTEAGGYTTYTCKVCAYAYTADETDPLPPAEPEEVIPGVTVDEAIVFSGEGVILSSTLDVTLNVKKALVQNYTSYEVIIEPTTYDKGNEVPGEVVVLPLTNSFGKSWYVDYKNIAMYKLGLNFNAYVKCYDANKQVVATSKRFPYTAIDLLKDQFVAGADANSDQGRLNAAVTDMINMCAKAQVYFGSQSVAAGSQLAALVESGNLVNKDFPQDYASTTLGNLNVIANPVEYAEGYNSTSHPISFAGDLNGAPVFIAEIKKATTNYPDLSKLKLHMSYTKYYNAPNGALVEDTIEGLDEWTELKFGKILYPTSSLVAMYDLNKTVTGVLTYDGVRIATFQYSLETYIDQYKNAGDGLGDLLTSIGLFSASARAYFKTI